MWQRDGADSLVLLLCDDDDVVDDVAAYIGIDSPVSAAAAATAHINTFDFLATFSPPSLLKYNHKIIFFLTLNFSILGTFLCTRTKKFRPFSGRNSSFHLLFNLFYKI